MGNKKTCEGCMFKDSFQEGRRVRCNHHEVGKGTVIDVPPRCGSWKRTPRHAALKFQAGLYTDTGASAPSQA